MDAVQYAMHLISEPSVSSVSNEPISRWVASQLERLGFRIEWLQYTDEDGQNKVSILAKRGKGVGGVAYFSHTDVVPADDWNVALGSPFKPFVKEGRLWGRGSCDMKGSLAAALAAVERIPVEEQQAPIYIVCTADEEVGTLGARQVNRESKYYEEMIQHGTLGIIGEPTELQVVHAHKGAVGMIVSARGISAHSSTGEGKNANEKLIPALPRLLALQQSSESDLTLRSAMFDPPTMSWNMVLRNEPNAVNITTSLAQACIFLRSMPGVEHESLVHQVRQTALDYGLDFEAFDPTPPFYVPADSAAVRFLLQLTGQAKARTVCYATDGGVLSRLPHMVVCGPGSIAQAHRNDEWISLDQLEQGSKLYEAAFRQWHAWLQGESASSVLPTGLQQATGAVKEQPSNSNADPNSSDYQVRAATPEDLVAVQRFLNTFVVQKKLLKRSRVELAGLLSNSFLAEQDGNIIGFCAIEIYSRKLGEIQCLAVSEACQGQGIGSVLVRKCVDRGREKGIMEVLAISSSDGFLRKIGFDYSLPDQKKALFCQLRTREEMYQNQEDD